MRNNIFGYLFIIFIIGIMGFAIYKVNIKEENKEEGNKAASQSSQNVEKIAEITLGIAEFDTINPIITNNRDVQDISKIIYEPLVNITQDYKIEECLATEVAKTNDTTYIIKLRQKVKWSDGSKFTSNDVKFTIDRLKEDSNSVYKANVEHVKEVDIVDDYTVRIILSKKVPFFEYYLNFPILSSNYYANEDFWNTSKNEAPVTTGSYKISEVTSNTITLEKNETWWNKNEKEPFLEKITINLYSTIAELYNAFKLGSIDLITTENSSYQDYVGTIGYNTVEVEGREFIFLALNMKSSRLQDKNIRKAVRNAINAEEIVNNVYGNMYKQANFPISFSNYLIDEKEENFFNSDEITNTLTTSGWTLKNGLWQKIIDYKTTRLELDLVVKQSDGYRVEVAKILQIQLAEQGILLNILEVSDEEYYRYLENKNYDMILGSITSSITSDLSIYFGNGNLANFENDEAKEIVNYADNINDANELKSKYERLYEIYNEEIPYIGIARKKVMVLYNNDLVGEINPNWYNLFYNMENWYKQ